MVNGDGVWDLGQAWQLHKQLDLLHAVLFNSRGTIVSELLRASEFEAASNPINLNRYVRESNKTMSILSS